jgi:diaminohydroxyphosphoribosylaminopyrimidine deaminase/5-amino-6-(5-phosphoribosylamino)uracil reductase
MAKDEKLAVDPEMDRRLMAAALRLGRRHLGRTHPAPSVGALVVRFDGSAPVVIGRGVTGEGGAGHAVALALASTGESARGATLYTTLEPALRLQDGTSDAQAIIAAGISRVVAALEDPRPGHTRAGFACLREAGIEVTAGVLGEEARRDHAGFLMRVTAGRPHVTLKLAVSADGMIGQKSGERMLVSGPQAFEHLQRLRIEADASMIGIGTALANDPRLNVRVPGLMHLSPTRVVLDSEARLPVGSALVATAREVPLSIFVREDADPARCAALRGAGADVVEIGGGSGGLDLSAALRSLGERGINNLLVEGGARVAASLVSQGFADAVVLYRAPVIIGPDGVRALAGGALSTIDRNPRYRIVDEALLGEDRMVRFERKN